MTAVGAVVAVAAKMGSLSLSSFPVQRRQAGLSLSSSAAIRGDGALVMRRGVPAAAGVSARRVAMPLEIVAKQNSLKRTRQNVKRRAVNRSRKSDMRTRVKKVLVAVESWKKNPSDESLGNIDMLLSEAYSALDKLVTTNTIHKNRAAAKKSTLALLKQQVQIEAGKYTPSA